MDHATREAFLHALKDTLGAAALIGEDVPTRNEQDWSALPVRPLAVIRPTTPEAVATAMRLCHAHRVAVVPQGGLTGLAGGARPIEGAVVISLERFAGIEEIDGNSSTITVRAGTPLELVQQAADDAGFFFALDLGSRGSCTIGGNLGTNAGGNRVLRYGMMRELVLGIEVVLPDGTLVTSLNKMLKNNAGYDLKQLFIGSEGTLGIVTRVVLRLHPKPKSIMAAMVALDSYEHVLNLLASVRGNLGPLLSAFEVMWKDYWDVATGRVPGVRNPVPGDHRFTVLLEAQGNDAENDPARFQEALAKTVEAGMVTDAAIARSLSDVRDFWQTRDAAGEFKQVLGPHLSFDIGLPVATMDRFALECRAALLRDVDGCRSYYYGHIADGNMHIIANVPALAQQPADQINKVIYNLVKKHGGTISAEHGIGLTKKAYLGLTRSAEEIAVMRLIKHALDPAGVLNPGKVFDMG
ncbi:FAD-binding oxidoreductase [Mesorhizobium sp. B3-1-3]|uniref:FAD-binding oxidoreductase n=1 Tax=unclassified Mesorhizobium TaxID=325217 RepID=UPI001125C311|nr:MULTISPECIES: FAD-binding oxidoreductase [unclassified Mesorhizobium]TPI65560.1 FAD-binding oxidoreductase [Mesorhizobium sp. B3-1-3]TPI67262.1 FAD-binding oxidoreductase [Mesorhizobium sp. B3-1-8]